MALMTWSRDLETNHPEIDAQHLRLLEAVNELHRAMKEGRGRQEVARVLDFLRGYTMSHFRAEEQLMAVSGYPDTGNHRLIHRKLEDQLAHLVLRHSEGSLSLTLELMAFLESWLTSHIQNEDRRLADHLAQAVRQGSPVLT